MSVMIANVIVILLLAYVGLGVISALFMVFIGVNKVDALAGGSGWSFRLFVFPGMVGLWPLMLLKYLQAPSGVMEPSEEVLSETVSRDGGQG